MLINFAAHHQPFVVVFRVCLGRSFFNGRVVENKERYFAKLGVHPSATKEEIKAAYFKRAKELHPDSMNKSHDTGTGEFNELNEAYNVLLNKSPASPTFDHYDRKSASTAEEDKIRDKNFRQQDKVILRRSLIAVIVGVFFGTIFPALFIGTSDYENDMFNDDNCQCNYCLLSKFENSHSAAHLKALGITRTRTTQVASCTRRSS